MAFALACAGSAQAGRADFDDGDPGPGRLWDPGKVLVKFGTGTSEAEREAAARRAGVVFVDRLPLVRNLYEVQVPGGEKVPAAAAKLMEERTVAYAQPDEYVPDVFASDPDTVAYWPRDELFYPVKFDNPNNCQGAQKRLGQWQFWGTNLSNSDSYWAKYSPVQPSRRAERSGGYKQWALYHSINVMPVWSLLRTANPPRLRGRSEVVGGELVWTHEDIQRSGIVVQDRGLSNNADISEQVAALFGVATQKGELVKQGDVLVRQRTDYLREVYRDDLGRDDLTRVREETEKLAGIAADVTVEDSAGDDRPLFAMDDNPANNVTIFDPPDPKLPGGCDGHGTSVASVAAATANNGIGITGVAFDAPIVGIRVGMPYDEPESRLARDNDVRGAFGAWRANEDKLFATTETRIQMLAITHAMRAPVLNMSYGSPLFRNGRDDSDNARWVLQDPALSEAMARLLSGGTTLGVAAAGNSSEAYGAKRDGTDADLGTVQAPCGLKLIPKVRNAWVGPQPFKAEKPYDPDPGIDWDEVNLLCVGGTTSDGSKLFRHSGRGPGTVEIAAPAEGITAANRPSATAPSEAVFSNHDGTSFAAPMVSGAVSLLREAAPKAPPDAIAIALRKGARPNVALTGRVRYGQLDVACSLLALRGEQKRRRANWGLIDLDADPLFDRATRGCAGKRAYAVVQTLAVPKNVAYGPDTKRPSLSDLIARRLVPEGNPGAGNSLEWQDQLTRDREVSGEGRLAFSIPNLRLREVDQIEGTMFDAGTRQLSCIDPGYRLTRLEVHFRNLVRPRAWFYPTDATAPAKTVELGFALQDPWYRGLVTDPIRIRIEGVCEYFADELT